MHNVLRIKPDWRMNRNMNTCSFRYIPIEGYTFVRFSCNSFGWKKKTERGSFYDVLVQTGTAISAIHSVLLNPATGRRQGEASDRGYLQTLSQCIYCECRPFEFTKLPHISVEYSDSEETLAGCIYLAYCPQIRLFFFAFCFIFSRSYPLNKCIFIYSIKGNRRHSLTSILNR